MQRLRVSSGVHSAGCCCMRSLVCVLWGCTHNDSLGYSGYVGVWGGTVVWKHGCEGQLVESLRNPEPIIKLKPKPCPDSRRGRHVAMGIAQGLHFLHRRRRTPARAFQQHTAQQGWKDCQAGGCGSRARLRQQVRLLRVGFEFKVRVMADQNLRSPKAHLTPLGGCSVLLTADDLPV